MKKFRTTFALLLLASLLAALLGLVRVPSAHAATPPTGTLSGSYFIVNNGPGDQADPHVSSSYVSYTDNSSGTVDYYNLATGVNAAIPQPNGGHDALSGISGSTVVYMHASSTDQQIDRYDIGSGNPPVALDPVPGAIRSAPAIGGQTVAWSDYTSDAFHPQLVAYNLATGVATTLTSDTTFENLEAAVSADGSVIVWVKCTGLFTGCDVWEAVLSGGTWGTPNQLTSGGVCELPHSNGQVVVYDCLRNGEQDIYWQPVGGGTEQQLSFAGPDEESHISGNLIVFDHFDPTASVPNWNVYVYSLATQTLYQVTSALTNENLSDISVGSDGVAHVVWQVLENDYNVYGFNFQVPTADTTPPVLSLPANMTVDATSPQGKTVTYSVTATDPDNPASQLTIACTAPSGTSYPSGTNVSATFPIGTTTVTCTASDPVGNSTKGTFQVTVKGAAQQVSDLITLVNSFQLSSSLQNALDAKLQDVLTAITGGQTATACSELTDFIGFVQSHTGKGITQSQATQLVTAAQQIQAVLGC